MLFQERGVLDSSQHYFNTISPKAYAMHFYLVSAGHFRCTAEYGVRRENFHSYLMLTLVRGKLHVRCDTEYRALVPGEVLLLDCHRPHHYYASETCEFYFIHFGGATSEAIYRTVVDQSGNCVPVGDAQLFSQSIAQMLAQLEEGGWGQETALSLKIYTLLCALLDAPAQGGAQWGKDGAIGRALECIHTHYARNLTLEEMAAAAYLSPYYFSRCFKKETGIAPYQYLLRYRIRMAKNLLHESVLSIEEIAQRVGFPSTSNFIYTFTRLENISPAKFRRLPL